jgi:Na+/proline symporter
MVGLIIAAVFAAAMSTISAELNSLATATVVDHYERYVRPGAQDGHYAWAARGATAFWGLYATVFAGFGNQLGSLIEAVNFVGSLFYGSMLGVFVLAFSPWKVSGTGAFVGMLAGLAAVAYASLYTEITFLWFNVIGCLGHHLHGPVDGSQLRRGRPENELSRQPFAWGRKVTEPCYFPQDVHYTIAMLPGDGIGREFVD